MNVTFTLNGTAVQVDVEPETMLLEVLRDELGLTSVRGTCGVGLCGTCTVLVEGDTVASCILLAPLVEGRAITTIEGVDPEDVVCQAFDRHHAYQCGYCIPGMVLTAKSMIAESRSLNRTEIIKGLGGNLCRCGCYVKIVDAIEEVGRRSNHG
ncbi:MAG TPA: (2Fe-2S)-binding protein [Jiangellaceae bacterium]|nr:(2Fe-2S)-binding protein [Jiangellaceae bacterium]